MIIRIGCSECRTMRDLDAETMPTDNWLLMHHLSDFIDTSTFNNLRCKGCGNLAEWYIKKEELGASSTSSSATKQHET